MDELSGSTSAERTQQGLLACSLSDSLVRVCSSGTNTCAAAAGGSSRWWWGVVEVVRKGEEDSQAQTDRPLEQSGKAAEVSRRSTFSE